MDDAAARLVTAARTLPAEAGPQELLAHVAAALVDLDDHDRVSLHLAAGDGVQVVAILPPNRPRTSSATARRVVQLGEPVVDDDRHGQVLAVPLVLEGRSRGALVLRRPHGRPMPELATAELATVLLAGAAGTTRWLEDRRDLDRARADFVARVSHELRTPLTIISGFAATLGAQDEDLSGAERHEMLDRIVTAAVRLEHLVEELLTLASVELGHTRPHPVTCVVRDVLDLVVRDQSGDDRVTVDCPSDLRVVTDPVVARLVLGPIVENALQHGERVEIGAEPTTHGVRIVVHDDGPGIPPDLGDRIFDRFVRGSDREPGFGLGLPTAREVGGRIGARLSLEEAAVGARVVVELPDRSAGTAT